MRPIVPILVLMLALPAASGVASLPPLRSPTCDVPGLEATCVNVIVSDIVVDTGDIQGFNNGTYVMQGRVEVNNGGRFEIILSTTSFTQLDAVTIHGGGTLVIDQSTVGGVPDTGSNVQPVILLEDGAILVVQDAGFTAIELRVETDDATFDGQNTYARGNPSVRLVGFDGVFERQTFTDPFVAINVTGGAPTIRDILVNGGATGIELWQTDATLSGIDMAALLTGIRVDDSQVTMTSMALSDRGLPPSVGLDVISTSGAVAIDESHLSDWGTAIRYCGAEDDVQIGPDTTFGNNARDVDDASC